MCQCRFRAASLLLFVPTPSRLPSWADVHDSQTRKGPCGALFKDLLQLSVDLTCLCSSPLFHTSSCHHSLPPVCCRSSIQRCSFSVGAVPASYGQGWSLQLFQVAGMFFAISRVAVHALQWQHFSKYSRLTRQSLGGRHRELVFSVPSRSPLCYSTRCTRSSCQPSPLGVGCGCWMAALRFPFSLCWFNVFIGFCRTRGGALSREWRSCGEGSESGVSRLLARGSCSRPSSLDGLCGNACRFNGRQAATRSLWTALGGVLVVQSPSACTFS